MSRSSWKNGYVDAYIFNNKRKGYGELTFKNISRTWSRRSIILPDFIGKTVMVHRGNGFIPIKIIPAMVGHKFGEFAFTRKAKSRRRK